MNKINIAVIFGGPSTEYGVSIITGLQVIENLDKTNYEILPVYWTRENKFLACPDFKSSKEILKKILSQSRGVIWDINNSTIKVSSKLVSSVFKPDIIFPALHGSLGEDGSFQGFLEVFDVPYVGSDVGASFISMDKDVFKKIMKSQNIEILPWQVVSKDDQKSFKLKFDFPVICKPNSLGSSIAVSKCNSDKELERALDIIFELDSKAIVEPFAQNMIEVNCSVLGNSSNQTESVCERPLAKGEVLNFEDKYLSGSKKGVAKTAGMATLDRVIPADIDSNLATRIQNLSKQIFTLIGAGGVVRLDFIVVKKPQKIYINEINSIPGSLAYYLWEASGISFSELLDKVIDLAKEEHKKKKQLKRKFESPVLEKFLNS